MNETELKQAKTVFRQFFNGRPNVMSPTVLEWGTCAADVVPDGQILHFEISMGGFAGDRLYGVTFLLVDGAGGVVRQPLISKCFVNVDLATVREYAKSGGRGGKNDLSTS